ncbi:nucleoside hydrolase 3 isoform X3 [Gossypium raimondii]|uniref:nucleoside hydrolase 3 isoform X3 n=1 Tax=Gossypium raimondii TaxID=29730 RepID=UPI00227D20B9|nr:nucleoside hydrolase 3 isoform X3 [Gossypium raimondii]
MLEFVWNNGVHRFLSKSQRVILAVAMIGSLGALIILVDPAGVRQPHRILVDTDVDTDDVFALFYLLKQDTTRFDLQAITVNANGWSEAGHAINHIYDILFMMGRDDIPVGVGGEGGILPNGTILPNVGGYQPIIDQGMSTAGECRYRQAIPVAHRGRLDVNSNYGIRKAFLPQGGRRYTPLKQPTAQQVMIDTISSGPTTVFLMGAHTNFAIFLMTNPHLKKNVKHIYAMGGSVRSNCLKKDGSGNSIECADIGNLYPQDSNPYAEFNIFSDPFAAYKVLHSGIPFTLIPLDATNSIPVSKSFFMEFERRQDTYEAKYCFQALKIIRYTWLGGIFYEDGYTKEDTGEDAVRVLVAVKAKASHDKGSSLGREFYRSFLNVINSPERSGRFDIRSQYPNHKEALYKPDFGKKMRGNPIVFDMDMSAGDFLALLYLLKLPVELINLKGILISSTGWATPATIDVVYDILHMMGRDDIPVGLGDAFAVGQANPSFTAIGDCKFSKAIPHGSGGYLDSDTLYGLARDLPRSPRRYTAANFVKYGAPRDIENPELRQPSAQDVWKSVVENLDPGSKITILTNGPLTNLAQILGSENASSVIQGVYIVGGHIGNVYDNSKGNLFTVPLNKYAELNMFLDPLAAKEVFTSSLGITLVPLQMQRRVSSFSTILSRMNATTQTPELVFARRLLSRLWQLQQQHYRYHHMDIFLGEILGAVTLTGNPHLNQTFTSKPLKVLADGDIAVIGEITIDEEQGKQVKVLENINSQAYYDHFTRVLGDHRQSAVLASFHEQERLWTSRPESINIGHNQKL